jgi:two-component system, NarL family, invasion response regulator UvrY
MTASQSSIRVYCVDDDAKFRAVVRALLESMPSFALVGEASCGEDAVSAVPHLRVDLVLMDVRMPGMGGIEAARMLLCRDRKLVVVLMSADDQPPPSKSATDGMVATFVCKQDLCRRVLRELWNAGARSGANWVLVRLGGCAGSSGDSVQD